MGNLTLKKVGGICLKVGGICITVLTVVGAAVTIIGFVFAWWGPAKNHDETITDLAFTAQPETAPQPAPETPTPTPTTTVVSNTKSMLKTASSIPLSSEQSKGLRTVATAAVSEFDYETAIIAGRATRSSTASGQTLSFVARCAAQDGLFDKADKAVSYIPSSSVRSKVTNEILEKWHLQDSLGISPSPGQPGWVNCR